METPLSNREIDEIAERIGKLADEADNYIVATQLNVPAQIHLTGLTGGMHSLGTALKQIHVELSGNNPWPDFTPKEDE
jgi:hypothetical protein